MNREEKKKSKGCYGFMEHTEKTTKKNPKVYADVIPLEEIKKNKTAKHLDAIDAVSYKKLQRKIDSTKKKQKEIDKARRRSE